MLSNKMSFLAHNETNEYDITRGNVLNCLN